MGTRVKFRDSISMGLQEVGYVVVDWIQLAVDGVMTRICDTSVFRYKRGVNLTELLRVRSLLHGVSYFCQ
jgi:hypothetical protein